MLAIILRGFWLLAMLKSCVPLFGIVQRKKESRGASISSLDMSIQLKDITVRIIHAGGREERCRNAIPASQLIRKYPGMCVARPEVFKNPHASILMAEEKLLPGQKYYIIPSTTVQKLKRKHAEKAKVRESSEGKEAFLDSVVVDGNYSVESLCSADFYVSKERWSRSLVQKCQREKKQFVPPIQKAGTCRGLGWEPSLTSVQELSP